MNAIKSKNINLKKVGPNEKIKRKTNFLDEIKAGEAGKELKSASKRELNVKPPVRQKTKGEIAMDAIIERGIAMNNPNPSGSGSGSSDWSFTKK